MNNQQISAQENFEKYYQQLNSEQKAAVDAIEGPVMTIAGAGTGKTQILAVRIAKILLETQIDPFNILCLTFTESGVAAMRKRLLEIIGPTAYHIKISTFHSFCNEIIKENPEDFVIKRDFEQIDDLEKVMLLRKIVDQLGVLSPIRPHGDPYLYLYDIENRIKDLKKENFTPEHLLQNIKQIENFLQQIQPLVSDFINIKGSPKEEEINQMAAELILAKIQTQADSHLQNSYIKYYQAIWQNYLNALTGEKRPDSTQRTKFKNQLKNFIQGLEKDLPKQIELQKAYLIYQEQLQKNARYDYEDMILMVSQKFKSAPQLLLKYQELYQYILVDEYQDTNSAQNQTVEMLGNYFESPNIFVVGDDDQSIYRFQGASIENIIDFHKRYQQSAEIKLITLIKNYRSQQTVLDASAKMISNNQTRIASYLPEIDKNLQSQRDFTAQKLQLISFENENNENFGVAKQIESLINSGTKASEIAVLYRNHRDAEDLIGLMKKLNIPFEIKAGEDLLKDLRTGQLIQLFKTIENPNDNALLINSLYLEFFEIDKLDLLKLSHYYFFERLEKKGYSLFQILNLPQMLQAARINNIEKIAQFAIKIAQWKELSQNSTLNEFFEDVIKNSNYLTYLMQEKDRVSALNRLNTLFKEIKNASRKNHQITITEFLEQLKLRQENRLKLIEEPLQSNREAVQLMTAHGSKGLEFEHVFIIKCTEKVWGNTVNRDKIKLPKGLIKSLILDEKQEQLEDERRLFYVALTRAKLQVHLSYAKFRSEQNKQKEALPSIFINEIPAEYLEIINPEDLEKAAQEHFETLFFNHVEEDFAEQEKAFIQKLAEEHVLSPTSLNNYLTCPRRFLYQNIIRIPQAKQAHSAMGTAVHRALELYLKEYKKTHSKPPVEFLTLHYKTALEKELLTEKDYQERLAIGQNILQEYYQNCNEDFSPHVELEYGFSTHGVNIDGINLTGKIDKITIDPNNPENLIVSDFKTGNPHSKSTQVKHGQDYWRQVIFYKILCDYSPKFKLKFNGGKMKVGRIEFIEKSKKTGVCPSIDIALTEDAINEVIENIRFAHSQIIQGNFEKIDKSDPCDRCPFYNLCWK